MPGAVRRAQSAHYPSLSRLEGVSIEAVAELDKDRMQTVVQKYNIPRSFDDYHEMLASVPLDAVYVIMSDPMGPIAVDCMDAGKHVFVEKPPGANLAHAEQLLEAAERNNVTCAVGYQRRYADVTREAMRRVRERGPATLAMGEFHKPGDHLADDTRSLWWDITHVVDLVRYMIGSEAADVTAYRSAHENAKENCFNALIRFQNNAVGIVTGCRHSGGRYLRAELHGPGIGCYMRLPERIEILEDKQDPVSLSGAEIAGKDPGDVPSYEGVLAMSQHFMQCIRTGQVPCTDIRDAIHTVRLVDRIAGTI